MKFDKKMVKQISEMTEGKDCRARFNFMNAGGSVTSRITRPNKMFGIKYEIGKYQRKGLGDIGLVLEVGRYDGDCFVAEQTMDFGEIRVEKPIGEWTVAKHQRLAK